MGRGESNKELQGDMRNQGFSYADLPLEEITAQVASQVQRVAELGRWPSYISPESILHRIPKGGEDKASGLDAGVACTLEMIPREKQGLSASLHAAYTPEAVERVRREEALGLHPDFETTWWLAACRVCVEGGIDEEAFREQIKEMEALSADPRARHAAARNCFEEMNSLFELREDGVPMSLADGGMQGAYVAGYEIAGAFDPENELYFIGTFHPSLGLEDFPFSSEVDGEGRSRSGLIWGSKQFVKCSTESEFEQALLVARAYLDL
jgi:hypothetical protein